MSFLEEEEGEEEEEDGFQEYCNYNRLGISACYKAFLIRIIYISPKSN